MYIQIDREDIWDVYTSKNASKGLFRGGGNKSSAKMFKKNQDDEDVVRPADFKIIFDKVTGQKMVYPDITKGLSFSNSLQRLQDIPIKGRVWLLPRTKSLPEGLVINYKTIDHPLVNVKVKMSVSELIKKLKELQKNMDYTGVTIR